MEPVEHIYQPPMSEQAQVLRAKLARSIAVFGKVCLPSAYRKDTPPFHDEIYAELQDPTVDRLLVAAPRGTAKSTLVSLVYPLYLAMNKKPNEDVFIVIVSESRPQSINFLARIKDHLNDPGPLRDIYGDLGEETAKRWREDDIILANGTRIVAIGTGSRIRGFIQKDSRPTHIVMDDIESETNALTKEARAKNKAWVTEAVLPSMSDNGSAVYIGTPFSEDCFLYHARASKHWKILWYSIIDEDGESIWPSKYPLSRITRIKEDYISIGNVNGFFQEYMCQAQSPDEAPFQPEYIRTHNLSLKKDTNGEWYLHGVTPHDDSGSIVDIPVDLYIGVDPASSLSATADFFVIVTLAVDAYDCVYVVNMVRGRFRTETQPGLIVDEFRRFSPVCKVRIETVGYQEALRGAVRAICQEESLFIPGLENGVKPRNSKSERLLSLVPRLAGKKFFFRPEDLASQDEFLSYPKGKHDDTMDAIWTALHKHLRCRRKEVESTNKKRSKPKILDWRLR